MIGEEIAAFDGRFLGVDLALANGQNTSVLLGNASTSQLDGAERERVRSHADSVGALLRMTSIVHEVRHFHDFMLAPIGALAVQSRFLAAATTMQVLPWLGEPEAHAFTLPVPLGRWLRMSSCDRAAYSERAAALFAATTGRSMAPVLELPQIESPVVTGTKRLEYMESGLVDGLRRVIPAVSGQLARADYVLGGIVLAGKAWYPASLFESNGLVMQAQQTGMRIGRDLATGLIQGLVSSDSTYGEALWQVATLVGVPHEGRRHALELPDVTTLCTYALLGSCTPSMRYGLPCLRFVAIGMHVAKHGWPNSIAARDIFAEWDEVMRSHNMLAEPTLAGLETSLVVDEEVDDLAAQFQTRLDVEKPEIADLIRPVTTSHREFVRVRRTLCRHFLDDPDSYVRPGEYLKSLDTLPRPPIRVTVEPGGAVDALLRMCGAGWVECVQTNDAQVIGYPPRHFLAGQDAFQIEALGAATDALAVTETLFRDSPRVNGYRALERRLGACDLMHVIGHDAPVPSTLDEGRASFAFE